MFEKEAEEIMNNHCDCEMLSECLAGIRIRCTDFEESKKLLIEGIEFGYNKANEWHYVKDGLPDEGTYLVVWQNDKGYKEILIMNYEEDEEEELHWVDGDCEVQDEYVIAWKEIILPKESE